MGLYRSALDRSIYHYLLEDADLSLCALHVLILTSARDSLSPIDLLTLLESVVFHYKLNVL